MIPQIQVDTLQAVAALDELGKRQIPFAAMLALNRTGEDANAALRQSIPAAFTLRDKKLLDYVAPRVLSRDQRATKANLSVILQTEAKGRILDPFEFGTPHTQRSQNEPVAVPTQQLRFQKQTVIPRRWYPSNLGLTPRRDPTGSTYYALGKNAIKNKKTPFKKTRRGAVQIQGKQRTFVLDPLYHRGISARQRGVYVRIGPSRGDIRMIWQFKPSVPRPIHLGFERTVTETVAARWAPNFEGALDAAMRTAR